MPDEVNTPKPTEKKRALAVRDLKPKTDPKGGAANGGKSDKATPANGGSGFRLDIALVVRRQSNLMKLGRNWPSVPRFTSFRMSDDGSRL